SIGTGGAGFFRHDFWFRVGKRHDERLFGHLFQKFRLQYASSREAKEDVSAADDISQNACICLLCVNFLPAVHQLVAAFVDDAFKITDPDVFAHGTQIDEKIQAAKSCSTSARCNNLGFTNFLPGEFQTVQHCRCDNDCGAV